MQDFKNYDDVLASPDAARPSLVLLGCDSSRCEEHDLVQQLVKKGWPVLILASRLAMAELRALFLAGATDVAERPETAAHLLSIVDSDLETLSRQQDGLPGW